MLSNIANSLNNGRIKLVEVTFMIIGKLKDLNKYKGISKNLDCAIEWVNNTDLLALDLGKHEIKGTDVYCNRLSYVAKPLEQCAAENHDYYLDLQIVIKGLEGFGYADITNKSLEVAIEYNPVKDVTKYKVEDECVYAMDDSSFALVLKEDIHKPMIKLNEEQVEKAVVKIKIDF